MPTPRRRTKRLSATAAADVPAGRRKLLFISNGHGEDAIAAGIIARLPPKFTAEAYPTLGEGKAYAGVCPVVGPRAHLPSEGWRNVRFSVLRDIFGGLIPTLWPGLRFFRHAASAYDRVVVVGDMIGVYGCWLTGVRNIVYADVYKTGYGSGYLAADRWILRRTAGIVFSRADALAESLRRSGIDARAAGNVMMDTIPRAGYDAAARRTRPSAVTVLPGSRGHAVENFALQAKGLRQLLPRAEADLFMAVAASVPVADLAAAAGMTHRRPAGGDPLDLGVLEGDGLRIHLVRGAALGDLLDVSDLVLSQAGTATVQAIGLGKPVVTFRAPADRVSRFQSEQRLFGEARQAVAADPAAIAARLEALLRQPALCGRLGALGRERIGGPGAIDAIISAL